MAKRSKLDLTRSGRIVGTAGNHQDGRPMYRLELDLGGITQGPGPEGLENGDRAVLRRYQVAAPVGSMVRGPIIWISVDGEEADPTLPPDSLGRPA